MANRNMELALRSLQGLATGDALGNQYFGATEIVGPRIAARSVLARPPWRYTDDTDMALSIVDVLHRHGCIVQDSLAARFAARYVREPGRGYGAMAQQVLGAIASGQRWQQAARVVFDGAGSKGNGAAMRVGPLGAYFCDDLERAAQQAALSAQVTHAHAEGIAGAVAIAVAAAWVAAGGADAAGLFQAVLAHVPAGATAARIAVAAELAPATPVADAVQLLGSGQEVLAEDTVPFALRCAAHHLDCYEEAIWTAITGLGDRDTTSAIAGSIVACRAEVPPDWQAATEALPVEFGAEAP